MVINIKLEVGDNFRNNLAKALDGKEVKRLATRREVKEMVYSYFSGLQDKLSHQEIPAARGLSAEVPEACRKKMTERGYDPETKAGQEYMSGWLGRGLFKR